MPFDRLRIMSILSWGQRLLRDENIRGDDPLPSPRTTQSL